MACTAAPRGTSDAPVVVRHRNVPTRSFGSKLIVARPSDGAPVVLEATAVVVWHLTETWITLPEVVQRLADAFPGVEDSERLNAATGILRLLEDDDLVERA